MICKFCGNEIDDHSEFCFVCGQKIPAQSGQEDLSNEPAAPAADPDAAQVLPVSEPADAEAYANVGPKDVEKAGKFARFISFLCPLIGFILYAVYTKREQTGKKHSIANAAMSGVCFYLIIGILAVVKKSMF